LLFERHVRIMPVSVSFCLCIPSKILPLFFFSFSCASTELALEVNDSKH